MGNLPGTRPLMDLCWESFYIQSNMCGLGYIFKASFSSYLGKTRPLGGGAADLLRFLSE